MLIYGKTNIKAAGVTVFNGAASFMNRQSVMIAGGENAGTTVQAKNFIIAVGLSYFNFIF